MLFTKNKYFVSLCEQKIRTDLRGTNQRTNRQTDRQTDGRINEPTDRQTNRRMKRWTNIQMKLEDYRYKYLLSCAMVSEVNTSEIINNPRTNMFLICSVASHRPLGVLQL